MQTNALGPEFGRFAGGVINLVSKSGSNDFHGGGYEFLRNKVLNANTFSTMPPETRGPHSRRTSTVRISADRSRKTRLSSFSGGKDSANAKDILSWSRCQPLQQRQGDFSNTRTANGSLITIYDPLSTCGVLGNPACKNGVTRVPFPNNIIPANRLDPTAKILANYWGQPNTPGQPFTNLNNFSANANSGGNNDEFNIRVDHTLSDRQRLFFRYTYWTNYSLAQDPYGTQVYQDRGPETWITNQAVVGDTFTLSPTTVLDLRVAFLRFKYGRTPGSLGTDLTKFGLPAALNSEVSFQVIPTPVVQGFSDIWTSQGPGSVIHQANDSYSIYPVVTKILGSHAMKFGGEVRRQLTNYIQSNVGSGLYNFDNLFTAINPSAPAGSGFGFASFMLGYGSSGNVVTPSPYAYRNFYAGIYFGDTWQVNKKLTVNYGVRWEMPFPEVERYDRFTVLLPNTPPSPYAAAAGLPNLVGRLRLGEFPGQSKPLRGGHPLGTICSSPGTCLSAHGENGDSFRLRNVFCPKRRHGRQSGHYRHAALGTHRGWLDHTGRHFEQSFPDGYHPASPTEPNLSARLSGTQHQRAHSWNRQSTLWLLAAVELQY